MCISGVNGEPSLDVEDTYRNMYTTKVVTKWTTGNFRTYSESRTTEPTPVLDMHTKELGV